MNRSFGCQFIFVVCNAYIDAELLLFSHFIRIIAKRDGGRAQETISLKKEKLCKRKAILRQNIVLLKIEKSPLVACFKCFDCMFLNEIGRGEWFSIKSSSRISITQLDKTIDEVFLTRTLVRTHATVCCYDHDKSKSFHALNKWRIINEILQWMRVGIHRMQENLL